MDLKWCIKAKNSSCWVGNEGNSEGPRRKFKKLNISGANRI